MAYRHVFIPIRGWFVGIGTSLLVVALHFAGIGVRLPLTIFATAVIFPLAFTIAEAFRRREFCLDRLGSITGGLRTMHVNICGLPSTTTKWERDLQDLALGLIEFLSFELAAQETESERHRRSVDIHLARMARWIHGMKVEAAETPGFAGNMDVQFSSVVSAVEDLRFIRQYRTPAIMRAFSFVWSMGLPTITSLTMAYWTLDAGLTVWWHVLIAALVAQLSLSLMMEALVNAQQGLEQPFDGIGDDDVELDAVQLLNSMRAEQTAFADVTVEEE